MLLSTFFNPCVWEVIIEWSINSGKKSECVDEHASQQTVTPDSYFNYLFVILFILSACIYVCMYMYAQRALSRSVIKYIMMQTFIVTDHGYRGNVGN